jgi:hypothetical protein
MYRGFPARLRHAVPHWVETGAIFHIRLAVDREKQRTTSITDCAMTNAANSSPRRLITFGKIPSSPGLCADAAEWRWWIERSALDDKSAGEAGKSRDGALDPPMRVLPRR